MNAIHNQRLFLAALFITTITMAGRHSCATYGQEIESTKSGYYAKLILIDVLVNDKPKVLALDTGASCTVFDIDVEGDLSGRIYRHARTKLLTVEGPQSIVMHGYRKQTLPNSIICDFSEFSSLIGVKIDGFIGAPLVQDSVVQLDFDTHEYFVRDQASPMAGEKFALHRDQSGRPCVHNVDIDGISLEFLIDTGLSDAVSVDDDLFQFLVLRDQIHFVRPVNSTKPLIPDAGLKSPVMGILRCMKLGPYELKNVPVCRSNSNQIGLKIFSKFHTQIDMRASVMTLQPNKSFHLPITPPDSYVSGTDTP